MLSLLGSSPGCGGSGLLWTLTLPERSYGCRYCMDLWDQTCEFPSSRQVEADQREQEVFSGPFWQLWHWSSPQPRELELSKIPFTGIHKISLKVDLHSSLTKLGFRHL